MLSISAVRENINTLNLIKMQIINHKGVDFFQYFHMKYLFFGSFDEHY